MNDIFYLSTSVSKYLNRNCTNMKLLISICICLCAFPVFSQEEKGTFTSEDSELMKLQLPPLSVLLDSAVVHAPERRYYELRQQEEESTYKSVNREWMKYITLDSYYKYGKLGLSSTNSDNNTPVMDAYTSQSQHWYQVGVGFSLPLLEFTDRKNRKSRQTIKIEQASSEADKISNEVKEKVIEQYNNALMHLSILKTKAELLDLNNVQYVLTEKNFIKGKIDIAELSRLKQLQVDAKIEYELTKAQYRTSIMILETLTGINIISK